MIKKIIMAIGIILIPAVLISITYLLGVITANILDIDSYYFVIVILVVNMLHILFNITNVIIHTCVQNSLAKKKPSEIYKELKQQKEELIEEVEQVRTKLLKGYKKEYYKIITIIIMIGIIIYCNGINYLCVFRLTDEFGLNEAYFTVLIFSMIVPFICIIVCYVTYLSNKINSNNASNIKSESLYPKVYELVENLFLEEGISKPIELEIYGACNVEISEDKKAIKIRISWILLKFLTEDELKSILYHEIGHYKNQDTKSGAILQKYSNRLDYLSPMGVSAFYSPFAGKVIYETSNFKAISDILFERMADDAVLEKGIGDTYASACFKEFALDYASEIDSLDFNLYFNTHYCFDETLLDMRYEEIRKFYMDHLDFFINTSKKHLPLQFSTHPTIRERIEKFSSGKEIDTSICNNKEYDEEILASFDKMNNELKNNLKQREEYKEAKKRYDEYAKYRDEVIAKDFDVDDNVLSALIDDAAGYCDYDFAKRACYKILERNPNLSRFNLFLGGLLFQIDLSSECVPYLEKVAYDNDYLYRDNACQILLQYYTYTGQKEEKDKIRELTLKVLDERYVPNPVDQLRIGDKYIQFKDEEVINDLIEQAEKIKEIKIIWIGTKKIKDNYCHHVIVVTEDKNLDNDVLLKIDQTIKGHLDLKNDKYMFYLLNEKQFPPIYKKKKYYIYVKGEK